MFDYNCRFRLDAQFPNRSSFIFRVQASEDAFSKLSRQKVALKNAKDKKGNNHKARYVNTEIHNLIEMSSKVLEKCHRN